MSQTNPISTLAAAPSKTGHVVEGRGPVVWGSDGRARPNPDLPTSFLSQTLLLEALAVPLALAAGEVLDVGCGEKPYEPMLGDRVTRYLAACISARFLGLDKGRLPQALGLPEQIAHRHVLVGARVGVPGHPVLAGRGPGLS